MHCFVRRLSQCQYHGLTVEQLEAHALTVFGLQASNITCHSVCLHTIILWVDFDSERASAFMNI